MIKKHLGETIDLHTGGVDLLFPHHENEIAQSQCCNGVDLLPPLVPQRAPAGRRHDDEQEQGQLLHAGRPGGEGLLADGRALRAALRPPAQAAQFHAGLPACGRKRPEDPAALSEGIGAARGGAGGAADGRPSTPSSALCTTTSTLPAALGALFTAVNASGRRRRRRADRAALGRGHVTPSGSTLRRRLRPAEAPPVRRGRRPGRPALGGQEGQGLRGRRRLRGGTGRRRLGHARRQGRLQARAPKKA